MTSQERRANTDCLACKLIGTVGLFGISAKVFYDAASHANKVNRVVMNTIGAGSVYVCFLSSNVN